MDPAPRPAYDPIRALTYFALLLVFGAVISVSAIVIYQIYTKGEADTVWVGQLAAIVGWALGKAGDIYNNRIGTTTQSAGKDATIAQQARTAAVIAGAAAPVQPAPAEQAKPVEEK